MTDLPNSQADLKTSDRGQLLRDCDAHIRAGTDHEKEQGAKIARKARALVVVYDLKLYVDAGESDFFAWAYKIHEIHETQAKKYLRVGRTLPAGFMNDVPAGIEAQYVIAGAPPRLWEKLRKMAHSGAKVEQIEAAARAKRKDPENPNSPDRRSKRLQRALHSAQLVLKLVAEDQSQPHRDTPLHKEMLRGLQVTLTSVVRQLQLTVLPPPPSDPDPDDRRTQPRSPEPPSRDTFYEEEGEEVEEVEVEVEAPEADRAAPRNAREAALADLQRAYDELKEPPARPPLWVPPDGAPAAAQPQLTLEQRLIQLRRDLHLADDDTVINASCLPPLPPPPPPPPPQEPRPDGVPYLPQPVASQAALINYPADWGQPEAYIPLLDITAVAGGAVPPGQLGILGMRYKSGEPIAINLNDCLALLLVGAPGGGKSYLLSVILENALQQIYSINKLPQPMAGLAIVLQPAGANEPELCSLAIPNQEPRERDVLVRRLRALPQGLRDVVILTEREHVEDLRRRNPHAQVHSLAFATEELLGDGLRIGMGLRKDQEPQYARTLQEAARRLRDRDQEITLTALLDEVAGMGLPLEHQRALLRRVAPFRRFIDDERPLRPWLQAGRLVLVHLHEDVQTYDAAMSLVALVLHTLVLGRPRNDQSPKLIVALDEGHKMADHPEVGRIAEQMFRQRRHLDINLVVATQDPDRLAAGVLQNLDGVAVFQHESEAWARALSRVSTPLRDLTAKVAKLLQAGMCAVTFRKWWMLDEDIPSYDNEVILMHVRPRVTHHSGTTQGAVR